MSEEATSSRDRRPDLTFHDLLCTVPFIGADKPEFWVDVGGESPGGEKLRGFKVEEGGNGWGGANVKCELVGVGFMVNAVVDAGAFGWGEFVYGKMWS